jgi:hypothetical protein
MSHTSKFVISLAWIALVFMGNIAVGRTAVRVLFVGNSLTYYNAMPDMVAQIGRTSNRRIDFTIDMLAQGGATIRDHLIDGELSRELAKQHYDFVVFQEVGGFPLCDEGFPG